MYRLWGFFFEFLLLFTHTVEKPVALKKTNTLFVDRSTAKIFGETICVVCVCVRARTMRIVHVQNLTNNGKKKREGENSNRAT